MDIRYIKERIERIYDKKLMFAYGTLLNKKRLYAVTDNNSILGITAAKLNGWRLVFHGGLANVIKSPDSYVNGAIYEISSSDEKHLDRYESYPNLYKKMELTPDNFTMLSDLHIEEKITFYHMSDSNRALTGPTDAMLKVIRDGYIEWKLDQSTLDQALTIS